MRSAALPALPTEAAAEASTGPLERPSKTQRKADSHDLQRLGEALASFSDAQLAPLAIDDSLREALRACRAMRSHEARRRQLQLVGKLMRRVDSAPLREAVAQAELGHAHDSLALHRAERWRVELLADDEATTRFAAAHAGVDVQQLRALLRSARKDAARAPEQRSGRAFRELFRFIREQASDA